MPREALFTPLHAVQIDGQPGLPLDQDDNSGNMGTEYYD
jgi:hypothetical protein